MTPLRCCVLCVALLTACGSDESQEPDPAEFPLPVVETADPLPPESDRVDVRVAEDGSQFIRTRKGVVQPEGEAFRWALFKEVERSRHPDLEVRSPPALLLRAPQDTPWPDGRAIMRLYSRCAFRPGETLCVVRTHSGRSEGAVSLGIALGGEPVWEPPALHCSIGPGAAAAMPPPHLAEALVRIRVAENCSFGEVVRAVADLRAAGFTHLEIPETWGADPAEAVARSCRGSATAAAREELVDVLRSAIEGSEDLPEEPFLDPVRGFTEPFWTFVARNRAFSEMRTVLEQAVFADLKNAGQLDRGTAGWHGLAELGAGFRADTAVLAALGRVYLQSGDRGEAIRAESLFGLLCRTGTEARFSEGWWFWRWHGYRARFAQAWADERISGLREIVESVEGFRKLGVLDGSPHREQVEQIAREAARLLSE